MKGTFRSLRVFNYKVWAIGALVSNIGTWMQRVGQDWLVLTGLTANNATALGIVMALQFGPQLLLLPVNGFAVDYFDRRKLLIATQAAMGVLALGLGLLTLSGLVRLWHVYIFAFLLGCVTAFDTPARQTFVSELVPEEDLSNAVALNSTSFNAARMIGPAVAGFLIASVGSGWVFLINAATFSAVLLSLGVIRKNELLESVRARYAKGSLSGGFAYIRGRPDLKTLMFMFFLIGTFGLNFPIYISAMSVMVFNTDAHEFGMLTSMMAVGSVAGALLSARREKPRISFLIAGTFVFGLGFVIAALMPHFILFGIALGVIGIAAQTFTTTANSTVQLSTEPAMRGRVMAIVFALAWGGTPLGAPLVGYIADRFGARAAMFVGAFSGFSAAGVGLYYLIKHRGLRFRFESGRLVFIMNKTEGTSGKPAGSGSDIIIQR
ncbi:MFS transporter [Geovibrio thiophilus]|uniref:MFS transporter n=1 Tax=Geovibrio thiophilus TaxID=139438 RepID=A0A3R5Y7V1_9BACT|nr:MFS transporter [Geovibrio thiophilus]QAR33812.1 MFS transporter [Geovibrio thiophilus]